MSIVKDLLAQAMDAATADEQRMTALEKRIAELETAPVPTPTPTPAPEPAPEPVPEPAPTNGTIIFAPRNGIMSEWSKFTAGRPENSVSSPGGTIKCVAYPSRDGVTSKACMQKNIGAQRSGSILRIAVDLFMVSALDFGETFLTDLEDNNAGSVGTRLKLNKDRTFRLDGGKLGFPSTNGIIPGRPCPMTQWFNFVMYLGLHERSGSVKVLIDGQPAFDAGSVPTVGSSGLVNQWQLGLTANSSQSTHTWEFKNASIARM